MTYFLLKVVHSVVVFLFLGNIVAGLFWMRIAFKTKNLDLISHSIAGVIRSDNIFTLPSVVVITITGIWAAVHGHMPVIRTGWIFWGVVLFSLSGLIFLWKISPLQRQIQHLTAKQMNSSGFDWSRLQRLYMEWEVWGVIAAVMIVAALVMMITRLPA